MIHKGWPALFAVTAAVIIAGLIFYDSGVVAATGLCAIYIALLSSRLPVGEFIRLDTLYQIVDREKRAAVMLSNCAYGCSSEPRHIHGSEMLEHTATERVARAYGHVKLSEALVRDTRHGLEQGIYWCVALFLIWGVITFARWPNDVAKDAVIAHFDPWKGAITVLIGLVTLFNSLGRLHWFRKQNESLQQSAEDQNVISDKKGERPVTSPIVV